MNIREIIREEVRKVMNPEPEVIQIDTDEGSAFGVIHFDREHLKNWVSKERVEPDFSTIEDEELFPIGILKNINVDEEHQGKGHGIDLMDSFMTECSHCSYIVLIADLGESQKKSLNLIDWYKQFGFEMWGEASGDPVMIKKNKDLDEIDLSINGGPRSKPGIIRQFPDEKKGGYSLNLSVDDGPHEFPDTEKLS